MDKQAELTNANQRLLRERTEYQREVEVLRSELDLCKAMLNTVSTLVVVFDPEGHIVRCNCACEQMTGYTLDEARNQYFWNLFTKSQEKESVKAVVEQIQVDKLMIAHEHDWVTKDGSRLRIAWDYTPFLNPDGSVKYVIGTGNTITSLAQAQQTLQEQAAKLSEQNCLLLARDAILSTTATAANALLTVDNLDQAINTALQIIGESLDYDRVCMREHYDAPAGQSLGVVRYLYEWNSSHVARQIEQPDFVDITYEGFEQLYFLLNQGRAFGGVIDEMPEPLRSKQKRLGVQLSYAIPIMVNSKYWGVVWFLDCREAKRRSDAELAVLKTTAACIGSAIDRDRIRRACESAERTVLLEREKAATERAAELAKANEALGRSLNRLTNERNLDSFLGHVLQEALQMLDGAIAQFFIYDPEFSTLMPSVAVNLQGEVLPGPGLMNNLPITEGFPATITKGWERMLRQRSPIYFDLERDADDYWPGTLDWHRSMGHGGSICTALMMGDQPLGMLGLALQGRTEFTASEFEFFQALAQQATLAIQLTRLADEAKQAAITREQEKAAAESAAKLAKANEALSRTCSRLANQPDLSAFLGYITLEAVAQLKADAGNLSILNEQRGVLQSATLVQHGQLIPIELLATQVSIDEAEFYQILLKTRKPRFFDLETEAHLFWPGAIKFHQQHNHRAVLAVPLFAGDQFLGHLGLAFTQDKPISDQGSELLQALAHQATLAIQLTQLAEEAKLAAIAKEKEKAAQERAAQLAKANEALQRSVEKMSQDCSLDALMSHILMEAVSLSNARGGGLFVRQSLTQVGFRPVAVVENGVLRSGEDWLTHGGIEQFKERSAADETGFFKHLAQGKINYLRVDEPDPLWWSDSIAYHQRFGYRVVMHIPMMLRTEVIGFFALCFERVIEPQPEIVEYLTTLANQATLALELTQLAEEAKQAAIAKEQEKAAQERVAELAKANEALKRSLDSLASEPSLEKFLGQVLGAIAEQFDSPLAEYWYHPEDIAYIRMMSWQGRILEREAIAQVFPSHAGLDGLKVPPELIGAESLQQRKQYLAYDTGAHPLLNHLEWVANELVPRGLSKEINVPLVLGGTTIGALIVRLPCECQFTSEKIELAQALAHQATLAIQLTHLAEEAKQEAAQSILLEERNRMAREIHDSLAQAFTGIVVHLEAIKRKLGLNKPDEAQTHLLHAGNLARDGLSEARRSVWALRPEVLESHDLPNALRHLAQHMIAETTVRTQVCIEGTPYVLPAEVEMNLLRIAQEALTNVLKYAEAQIVRIELLFEAGAVHLHIIDDGQGFNKQQQIYSSGFGLITMQERSQRLGGQLTITSKVGVGTQISVTVPTP